MIQKIQMAVITTAVVSLNIMAVYMTASYGSVSFLTF